MNVTPHEARLIAWLVSPEVEGGLSNHPADAGGATNGGITAAAWGAYAKLGRPATLAEIAALTVDDVSRFYLDEYLRAPFCRYPELPWPISVAVFDAAVLFGTGRVNEALQAVLGVTADRKIGERTIEAAWAADMPQVVLELARWRVARHVKRCREDASQLVFLAGWCARAVLVAGQAHVRSRFDA